MLSTLKNISRLCSIAKTLARNDLLFLLENAGIPKGATKIINIVVKPRKNGRVGERIVMALQELGPTFIKFGQALSTRSDILGEQLAKDLSELQDNLSPFDKNNVRRIIELEMGVKIEECFSDFIWEPVAAASISQVHFAITKEGAEVAVKVLRPNIEQAFEKDIILFLWIAEYLQRFRPDLHRLKLIEIIKKIEETVLIEMDFRLEAAAAQELAENFSSDKDFKVPTIDWRRTSRRVLTMERINGIAIDERNAIIAAGHDPNKILIKAATSLFKQVFRDGFFHADQHPGNLFVGQDGAIIAVDFGIMGRLEKPTQRYLGQMLLYFIERNYSRVAELHFEAGYVASNKSVQAFTQACRSIAEPILNKPQNEISIARLLTQLFQVTRTFEMETQPDLLLLQKTMLTAEGVGRTLSPEANLWTLAEPLIKDWIQENMGPDKIILNAVGEVADSLRRLPVIVSNMEKNMAIITKNGIKLSSDTVQNISEPKKTKKTYINLLYITLILVLLGQLILN
jgi:ubiquinone biosynthesis protein